jgi:anti-anti-sigma regulatory factor
VPYSIERWQDTDILVVRGSGEITAADNDVMLRVLESACEMRPSRRVILDLTDVDYVPSAAEARGLATSFTKLAKPRQCLMAVVARPGAQYGVARMIESLSSMEDVTATAFGSMDEAAAWMLVADREE